VLDQREHRSPPEAAALSADLSIAKPPIQWWPSSSSKPHMTNPATSPSRVIASGCQTPP
jgi:hypothetical protein